MTVNLSVVIPVYNAHDCLEELYRRLVDVLVQSKQSFEIVLIDDCSQDDSWDVIKEISLMDERVHGYRLSRNFGQHHALTAGFDLACGERVVTMDCDLQDRPEDIPTLLAQLDDGYDVAIACWKERNDKASKKITALAFYKVFSWLAGYKYDPGIRSFRAMERVVVDAMCRMREQMRSMGLMGTWLGFETAFVHLERSPRAAGVSSYSWRKLFRLAVSIIISSSDKPLKISVWLGFAMALLSFMFGAVTLFRALYYSIPVPGWSSLMTSMYFIGGLILANLGVIGVYLARTFDETKGRPLYVIAKSTRLSGKQPNKK